MVGAVPLTVSTDTELDPGTRRRLESYVTEWMSDDGVPGASVAVVEGEDLAYAEGFGARDLSENLPATPHTLYGIGSCTKSFVATATLQRVATGDLDLADPVGDYLPHLEDAPGDPVTLADLLSHTSGMPSDGNLSALVTRLTDIGDANVPLTSDDDFRRHVQSSAEERYTARSTSSTTTPGSPCSGRWWRRWRGPTSRSTSANTCSTRCRWSGRVSIPTASRPTTTA